MTILNFRITGSSDACDRVISRLQDSEIIDSVEEVTPMLPHMDDEDSSSAGLAENNHAGVVDIKVHADSHCSADEVLRMAEYTVRSVGAVLEETDPF